MSDDQYPIDQRGGGLRDSLSLGDIDQPDGKGFPGFLDVLASSPHRSGFHALDPLQSGDLEVLAGAFTMSGMSGEIYHVMLSDPGLRGDQPSVRIIEDLSTHEFTFSRR
jgi:hypothetical protein